MPIDCAPDDTVTIAGGRAGHEAFQQQVGQQERREVIERERVLEAIGGHVAVRPEAADVVEQHVQPRIGGEHLVRQPPDLGLRRHVGDEDIDRGVA